MSDVPLTVGDVLRDHLERRRWSQADLADVIGKTTAAVNEIIQGKRSISSEMAALLAAALDTTPEYWLTLDAGSKLPETTIFGAKRRAALYGMVPVREMVRRGWIKQTDELPVLESELKSFFRVESLDTTPTLSVATRRSNQSENLTPSQLAWCFRARNMAADLITNPFDDTKIDKCASELRDLAAHAPATRKVPQILAKHGIRFVIVQPFSDSKIDGAALWLDIDKPVIALSLRRDQIDSFWFTLFHELSHVRHKDGLSVDSNLRGEDAEFSGVKPPFERRADQEAAESLIPDDRLASFISRLAPMYSKDRIVQFAHRIRIHPGIIVGQLQHRGEIRFSANREMLVKIRERVIPTSVVDGWGNSLS